MIKRRGSADPVAAGKAPDAENIAPGEANGTNQNNTIQPPAQLIPDLALARRHLLLLDEGEDNFVFQTFDDNKDRKNNRLVNVLYGSLEQHEEKLIKLNKRGAGIFVTVNHSSNGGRKKADIDGCRAIFREADEPNLPELPLEPHIRIESSPGKHHEYLLIDRTDDFTLWDGVMNTMVEVRGSDPNAKDCARVLRLAGFYHQKDPSRPHMVRIVHESGSQPYTLHEVARHIPPTEKRKEKATVKAMETFTGIGSKYGQAALARELEILRKTKEGGRNSQLNKSAFSLSQLVAGGELDHDQVAAALMSAVISIGLSESEAMQTIKSGMEAGAKEPRIAPASGGGGGDSYRLTELGNAERFRDQHGEVARYVTAWKKWIFYDGKRWKVGADCH